MSQKWRRSKQWDDEHIPSWAWPAKFVLRAFSSITFAVVLLGLVVVYAILASVPIGMLALIPTYLVYGLTLIGLVAVCGFGPAALLRVALRGRGRGVRILAPAAVGVGLGLVGAWFWKASVWPVLHYDPATGSGLRLFAGFAERYYTTTLRRLPGLEMSELEFYSWWPLRVVLLAFVVNMVTATVRRIEFTFPNIGVLTVHTGIVVMAVGSVFYKGFKQEGDTLLLAGHPGADGLPTIGPPQNGFYDNTDISLWVDRGAGWEQRRLPSSLEGVPRYNDYGLGLNSGETALTRIGRLPPSEDGGRSLDIPVPPGRPESPPDGFDMRVVGYASYARDELLRDWVRVDPRTIGVVRPGQRLNPVRFVELLSAVPDEHGHVSEGPAYVFFLLPDLPPSRVSENPAFGLEYTKGMAEERWAALTTPLPEGTAHALVVEVPASEGGEPFRAVYAVKTGDVIDVGETGFRIGVQRTAAQPPFPIITEGYRNAQSSVAVLKITPPGGEAYDRWVYSRFPEISQDLLAQTNERGMPTRRNADPGIRVQYVDASKLQVHLDEREDGSVRAAVREPGGGLRVEERLEPGATLAEVVPRIGFRLAERWEHAEPIERPAIVPEPERDNAGVGTHQHAMLAVEVSTPGTGGAAWKRTVWLPFTKYMDVGMGTERTVDLPDGRQIKLAFGRRRHPLPGFLLQLVDFQMIAYDHRGAPRDYQSVVAVRPNGQRYVRFASLPKGLWERLPESWKFWQADFEPYQHVTKLNAPLQAPFMWSESRSWPSNALGLVLSRLSPQQFKFSQAGWDAKGWEDNQARADRGEIPRPFANFTILGVGNNPGIHIIALGGVLVAVGTPWAFYIKPLIVRARKRKIQRQLADGTYARPVRSPAA